MNRIVVIGTSGAGKSTLARSLGSRLAAPVVELDALHHLPGWKERPVDEFRSLVTEATRGERWVVDGGYALVRDLVWPRAEMVVWLDYPRWRVMSRVMRRTLRRVITREEVWTGVQEPWSNLFSWKPERSIVAWAWTTHDSRRRRYAQLPSDPRWAHLEFRRVTNPRQVKRLIAHVDARSGQKEANSPTGTRSPGPLADND